LRTFPRQVGDDNEIMLGEFMLLAILGNVPVLGSFIAITAAYHIKLGSRRPPSPPACHRALPGAAIAAAIATASLAAAAIAAAAVAPPPLPPPPLPPPPSPPPTTVSWVAAYPLVRLAVYHPSEVVDYSSV
tara:strand:+ start:702 stop:1094 length:393 start_codon:yes stop_codon:yes gene_type:complete